MRTFKDAKIQPQATIIPFTLFIRIPCTETYFGLMCL